MSELSRETASSAALRLTQFLITGKGLAEHDLKLKLKKYSVEN